MESIFQFNGGSLERLNSFDRLMFSLTTQDEVSSEDLDSAAELVQSWFRRKTKMQNLLNKMTSSHMQNNHGVILDVLKGLNGVSFDDVQSILVSLDFTNALKAFLCSLPRDPILRNRNAHCRTPQFIASAIIYTWNAQCTTDTYCHLLTLISV